MDANKIIETMNEKLKESIKSNNFSSSKLDDITFEAMEKLKNELIKNTNKTLEEAQNELKKRNVLSVQK